MGGPRFAAHRGGAALWPENSVLAFRNALALGAPLLELDVHLTADGEVAVVHDRTLERTTEGAGLVSDRTAPALRGLRLRGPDGGLTEERLPMLDDILGLVARSGAGLLVEIKGPSVPVMYEPDGAVPRPVAGPRYEGLEAAVLARLERHRLWARTTIIAFNPDVIACVRGLAPSVRTALLVSRAHVETAGARPTDVVAWARLVGAPEVGLEHTLVERDVVEAAHGAGLGVGVWTVNDEPALRRFARLGVDLVTTDRPDLAVRVLGGGA
jgi:glycerophosphoryl diester phosphodiesterase